MVQQWRYNKQQLQPLQCTQNLSCIQSIFRNKPCRQTMQLKGRIWRIWNASMSIPAKHGIYWVCNMYMYVRIHSTIFSLLVWTNCQTKSCNFFHTFLSTFLGLVFKKQNLKKGCRNSLGDDGINSSLQSNFVWGAIVCDTDIIGLSLLNIDAKSILFPKFHVRMNTKHLNAFSLFVQYNNTVIHVHVCWNLHRLVV